MRPRSAAPLALTDECPVSGVMRAHHESRERGQHFIVGSEIQLSTGNDATFARLMLLAQDRRGCGNLCKLTTLARQASPRVRD